MLFFSIFSISYLIYNVYHINKLRYQYIEKINEIYSTARRFGSYYNNADTIYLNKGLHKINDVSVIVHHSSDTKALFIGINKLRSKLNKLTNNNIWTIALFENPISHSYFNPIREQYINWYDNLALDRLINDEGLKDSYQFSYSCDVKLTEEYIEIDTDAVIRTLYYPIYNNKHLDAVLAIDIKSAFLKNSLLKYNAQNMTIINANAKYNIYELKKVLPCSTATQRFMHLGVNLFSILKFSFPPAIFFFLLYKSIFKYISNKKNAIRYDYMTHFYRRDFYEKKLLRQHKFSLLIIDIDHFKKINDTHGHKIGDDVIRIVAKRIKSCIREQDVAIRWGGEEFLISFNKYMHKDLLALKALNICKQVELSTIIGIKVTISIGGVAVEGAHFNEAYNAADNALYQSKHNGRNQATIV